MATTLRDALTSPQQGLRALNQWVDDLYAEYRDLVTSNKGYPVWSTSSQEPSQNDALNFLSSFFVAVAGETKKTEASALKTERVKAIGVIQNYVQASIGSAKFAGFPNIDRFRFAIELALRVRRPRVIDQSAAKLCGSASVLQGFFKTDPIGAVKFAWELADQGKAVLRNKKVDPPSTVKTTVNTFNESPVDWCMLGSLRYHFEPLATGLELFKGSNAADPLRQYTKPGLLVSWLNEMGYSKVEDRTFGTEDFNSVTKAVNAFTRYPLHGSNRSNTVGQPNLQKAVTDLNLGRLIFLWAYGSLSDKATERDKASPFPAVTGTPLPQITAEGFPALHWTLVRKLEITGNQVKIRLNTWGDCREATFDKNELLDVYLGHVKAEP